MTPTHACPGCGSQNVYMDAVQDFCYFPNRDAFECQGDGPHTTPEGRAYIQCQDCGNGEDNSEEWRIDR